MTDRPLILWFRRDLRLADHPMLAAAVATGRPLIPVFILDPETEAVGAAAKWRLGLGVAAFAQTLQDLGNRLILRRGPALPVLQALVADLSSTISYIRIDNMGKIIFNNYDAPKELIDFQRWLEKTLDALDWKEIK